jgi:putative cell wall-binding protein
MKAIHLMTLVFATLLLTMGYAAAEDIDSVILTTKTHYPDTIVAGAVANKIGAPVFVTSQDKVDTEILDEISSLGPTTVYIVGGTSAISEEVETELAVDYEVVRIWGMTRYGTAAELAGYFWESSGKAMLVWDVMGLADAGNYEMLAEARDLAIQDDMPVLLIKKNEIPEQVVNTLVNLSVESVVLVGNLGSDVTATLEELGIEVEEEIKGADEDETNDRIREKVKEKIRERKERPLVVVAVGNWDDSIKAPYSPNGTSRHISSEAHIDDLIAEINDMNYTNIKIVGKPELAQTVHDRLTEADIDAELISGRRVVNVAIQVMQKNLEKIRERAAAMEDKLREMFQRRVRGLQEEMENLVERTKNFIDNSELNESLKNRYNNWVDDKKESFDGNMADGKYAAAFADYTTLRTKISELTLRFRTRMVNAYQNLVQQETKLREMVASNLDKLRAVRQRVLDAQNV